MGVSREAMPRQREQPCEGPEVGGAGRSVCGTRAGTQEEAAGGGLGVRRRRPWAWLVWCSRCCWVSLARISSKLAIVAHASRLLPAVPCPRVFSGPGSKLSTRQESPEGPESRGDHLGPVCTGHSWL